MAIVGLIGGLIGAAGTIFGAIGKQKAYAYNAQVAENNARMAGQYAARISQTGTEMATRASQEGAVQIGKLKTQLATGTDIHGKSAQAVIAGQREANKLTALTVADKYNMEAYSAKVNQYQFAAQAPLDVYQGDVALAGGVTQGIGEGLGAVGKAMPTSWVPGLAG